MGTQRIDARSDPETLRVFTDRLLRDLDRLESLLESDDIESGPSRIGAELEMFVVDRQLQPSKLGPRILDSIQDPRITPELGTFNLEANTEPMELGGTCLSDMERQLLELLDTVRSAAHDHDSHIVLTGILPTLEARHASLEFMTPAERYHRLNDALTALRGGEYHVFIKGVDEINIRHDSVMLEACNTSFQVHLQVDPARFARVYNLGLLALAPLLAVGVNSPLLFGRRLWRETRIALFQQSIDTRRPASDHRVLQPRVDFGAAWVDESVLEIYRDDVARFRALIAEEPAPDPRSGPPKLAALQLFNSTVYRWLRPCYGVAGGTAHLRIENRILPAGPTPVDQIANAAFWYGLLFGLEDQIGDPREEVSFDEVRENFFSAARFGLGAPLTWCGGRQEHARDLIAEELLAVARRGLELASVDPADADRYVGIIAERTATRQTGAAWLLESLGNVRRAGGTPWVRLTRAMMERQMENAPVHEWSHPDVPPSTIEDRLTASVGRHMQRDLVTAQATDPVSLAIHLMQWKRIRHLPVEDADQRLVGIVTRSILFRFLANHRGSNTAIVPLSTIMEADLVTAEPETTVGDAILLMRSRGVSSLPVVENGRLVGLVTERDFLTLAASALSLAASALFGPGAE